ncbi:MAG: TIR domain-containing protein [Bacteroidetes bacterium]|nr:TIR domain-containing protein [Bacteroidota bacterium]
MDRFDTFLCHSSADKTIVREIKNRLAQNGIISWLDEEQIGPGDPITTKIEEGLANSKHIIVCLSKNLSKSNWVRREYGSLLHKEISLQRIKVIPILLEKISDDDIPVLLYDKLRIDISDQIQFSKLVNFIKSNNKSIADPILLRTIPEIELTNQIKTILRYHNQLLDTWESMGSSISQTWIVSGWGSAQSQKLRFKAILDSLNYVNGSILDIGCGLGDFVDYLQLNNLLHKYEGWDFNPRLIEYAGKFHPNIPFKVLNQDHLPNLEYDYIIASGIFQYKDDKNPKYYLDICRELYARAKIGISVNFLSSYRDKQQMSEGELYLDPSEVINELRKISGYWNIDHSYHPGLGDFTIALHRPIPNSNPWLRPDNTIK